MTQKKRKRKERNNAEWQANGLAIREVQTALLTDDERERLITLTDEDRKCVAFFFFLFVSSGCARARIRSFSARLLNELTKILISLLSFLSFARSRHINEVKKDPYEVKGEKGRGGEGGKCTGLITFDLLVETSGLEGEAQARALGISRGSLNYVWEFFGYRKLGYGMAGAISAGEHMFDDGIMKDHGYEKGNGVSVFAWYALLDDEKKKLVNNNAAQSRRRNAKNRSTPSGVVNEKGEALMKSQLRYEKKKKKNTCRRLHVLKENWQAEEFPDIVFYNDENKWCPLCDGRTIDIERGYCELMFFSFECLWETTKELLEMARGEIKVRPQDVRGTLSSYFQGKFHANSGVVNFDSFERQRGHICYHCLVKAENHFKAKIGLI